MNIPAPTPLGRTPTLALSAPFGWVAPEHLAAAKSTGRAPVFLHRLGDEKARQNRGPREFREETAQALENAGWNSPWGLGAICRSPEDAAQFAVGGFTWFTLELSELLEPRAGSMSLDELDTAIVALEDQGAFRAGWHERYLDNKAGTAVRFSDEALARSAVRYGAALAEVEQIVQALRVSSSERGELPDLEISVARALVASTPEELAFLAAEILHRSLIHGGVTRVAPSLGISFEPARLESAPLPGLIPQIQAVFPPTVRLSLPRELAEPAGLSETHWDAAAEGALAWLRRMAAEEPGRFREWLNNAHELFPTARIGWNLSTSEDDVRFLPEVADDVLASTFLDSIQGRQLLLATWEDLSGRG